MCGGERLSRVRYNCRSVSGEVKAACVARCQSETLRRDTIAIARVICIFGIVYTHAWTGIGLSEIRNHGLDWTSGLYWFLVEVFSRSSVPLLSVISGWLVAASIDRRDYWGFVREKAQGLLGPMLVWNLKNGRASCRERVCRKV